MEEAVRVYVEKPMTLEDLIPGEEEPFTDLIITRIYAGGSRIDGGWQYRWDGIGRHVPDCIPRKHKGKKLQAMDVIVSVKDGMTVETIFGVYTGYRIEYGIFVKE